MRYTRSANLHTQLYDILKYRFTYKGCIRSDKQKENLNDLVLSELNLIANSSYKGFETENYIYFSSPPISSIPVITRQPYAYIKIWSCSSMKQTHDSKSSFVLSECYLGSTGQFTVRRIIQGDALLHFQTKRNGKGDYSAEFRLTVQVYIYLYEFYSLFNTGNFKSAQELQQQNEEPIFKRFHY